MKSLFTVSVTKFDAQATRIIDYGRFVPAAGKSLVQSLKDGKSGRYLQCPVISRGLDIEQVSLTRAAGGHPEISDAFMKADTDKKKIAFTARYGVPGDISFNKAESALECEFDGFETMRMTLIKIRVILQRGDTAEIQNLYNQRRAAGNRRLEYKLGMLDGNLVPEIVVPSLFNFCAYEMLTAYLMNKTIGACEECGGIVSGKRADARYCAARCRVRAHYHARKAS